MTNLKCLLRRLVPVVTVFVVVLGASSAWAHDQYRFVGAIVKADLKWDRISVKFKAEDGQESTVTLYVPGVTRITRNGKTVSKAALKVGLSVVVDAVGDGYDDLQATEVRIVPAASAK